MVPRFKQHPSGSSFLPSRTAHRMHSSLSPRLRQRLDLLLKWVYVQLSPHFRIVAAKVLSVVLNIKYFPSSPLRCPSHDPLFTIWRYEARASYYTCLKAVFCIVTLIFAHVSPALVPQHLYTVWPLPDERVRRPIGYLRYRQNSARYHTRHNQAMVFGQRSLF